MLTFTVYGQPQPQGSTRAFIPRGWNRPVITTDNKRLKPWRQEVAAVAREQMQDAGADLVPRPLAVRVEAQFYFARPKSAKKHQIDKTTKPDVEKLARALLDALSGICYEDDAQVSQGVFAKYLDTTPRTVVTVRAVELNGRCDAR